MMKVKRGSMQKFAVKSCLVVIPSVMQNEHFIVAWIEMNCCRSSLCIVWLYQVVSVGYCKVRLTRYYCALEAMHDCHYVSTNCRK